jgi:ribose transport system substrate-binding protein
MTKPRFLISLTTRDNDYQEEQAIAARETARRLNVDVDIIDADNDAINQSEQLLGIIHSSTERPDAIVLEPVGTTLATVARAAVKAGIGWVMLNREMEYVAELRNISSRPVFSITSDHVEIGRIQGKQFNALLPRGGCVLYIEGPSGSSAARQRTAGMVETKAANIEIRTLRGAWTSESAQNAVTAWLRLSTSAKTQIQLIGAQDDSMAMGAYRAFQQLSDTVEKERWLQLPYTGCDGLPQSGQKWVREGWLAATVVIPPNTGLAIEMLVRALQNGMQAPEHTLTSASSYPPLEAFETNRRRKGHMVV